MLVPPLEIGTRLHVRPGDLQATIRPALERFVVGEFSAFAVRIVNRSAEPVVLISSVDPSPKASPQVTIEIEGPRGVFAPDPEMKCGNTNGIERSHFVEVGPGEEFDPCDGGPGKRDRFVEAGLYRATLRYVTTETDPRRWIAQPTHLDSEMPREFRELFTRVPAVDLIATGTFRVHDR